MINNTEESKNSVILYFHSKCMVSEDTGLVRCPAERILFKYVIEYWKQNIVYFKSNPSLNKAGLNAAPNGYMWGNFW